jgi:ribosomal protein S18 acetylase RimI-like enzyme/predicted nucleotidyltransferase
MSLQIQQNHLYIIKEILKEYDFSFFAFGSRVIGNNKQLSDLDIFYFEDIPNIEIFKIEEAFEESDLPFKIDIISFKKCDQSFQKILLKNYLCIKCSSRLQTIENNYLNYFSYLPKNLSFDINDINGVTAINCGVKNSIFNIVYGAPHGSTCTTDKIKRAYTGQSFAWWIPPSAHSPDTIKILIDSGFILKKIEPVMICDLRNALSIEQKADLLITQVTTKLMLADFMSILEQSDSSVGDIYECRNDELLYAAQKCFVGYACNQPVSIAMLFLSKDTSGIFSLVTRQEFQEKGYDTDMIIFLMSLAKNYGSGNVTLLAANDSAYGLYKSLGFYQIGEFQSFEYQSEH